MHPLLYIRHTLSILRSYNFSHVGNDIFLFLLLSFIKIK